MKTKIGTLVAAAAFALTLVNATAGAQTTRQQGCGPKISLLLWPKGYAAYPRPVFEVFQGVSGPYGTSNILAYGSAAKDGALGYPATTVQSDCLDYGSAGKLSPAALGAKQTGALRLACSLPKAAVVSVKRLPRQAKRVQVILPPATVVADATVTARGSSLKYASKYCVRKHTLLAPSS